MSPVAGSIVQRSHKMHSSLEISAPITCPSWPAISPRSFQSRVFQTLHVLSCDAVSMNSPVRGANFTQVIVAEWAASVAHTHAFESPKYVQCDRHCGGKRVTSGDQSADMIPFECLRIVKIERPERRSHTRPTPPKSPVATREPSGWNAIAYVSEVWPSWSNSSEPFSASQSRHVLSKDVVPTWRPIGCHFTRASLALWPSSVTRESELSRDHNFAVLSTDAVLRFAFCSTVRLVYGHEFGWKSTNCTLPLWPRYVSLHISEMFSYPHCCLTYFCPRVSQHPTRKM